MTRTLLALSFLFVAFASFADVVREQPVSTIVYGPASESSVKQTAILACRENGRMAIFDDVEARAFGDAKRPRTIYSRQSKVCWIEHLAASTIDAPEGYERWARFLSNTSIAFHRFCGKRCGKACAKLERARQMRVSERFAQLVGRIDLTTGFT